MDTEEYFKDLHLHELDRKNKILRSVTFLYGVALFAAGATYQLVGEIGAPTDCLNWAMLTLCAFSAAGIMWALFKLFFATYRIEYKYPATAKKLKEHQSQLHEFHERSGTRSADQDFRDFLNLEHVECADFNASANDRRSALLNQCAHLLLFSAFMLFFVAVIKYIFSVWISP